MATKKFSNNDITKILAFFALLLSAVIWVLSVIGISNNILTLVKDVALLSAISLPAYSFAKSLGKTWVLIFWIIFLVFVAALIFGSFSILKV